MSSSSRPFAKRDGIVWKAFSWFDSQKATVDIGSGPCMWLAKDTRSPGDDKCGSMQSDTTLKKPCTHMNRVRSYPKQLAPILKCCVSNTPAAAHSQSSRGRKCRTAGQYTCAQRNLPCSAINTCNAVLHSVNRARKGLEQAFQAWNTSPPRANTAFDRRLLHP